VAWALLDVEIMSATPSFARRFAVASALVAGLGALSACSASSAPEDPNVVTTIGAASGDVQLMTAYGGNLYWTCDEVSHGVVSWSVLGVSEDGGNVRTIASNLPQPGGLAADANRVYWTDPQGGKLLSAPAAGEAAGQSPEVVASGIQGAYAVVVLDDSAYVASADMAGAATYFDTVLVRIPLDGGARSTVATHLDPSIATDGTAVYALVHGSSATDATDTVVRFVPGASAPTAVHAFSQIVWQVVADDGVVFALTTSVAGGGGNADIVRVPLDGSAPTTLVSGVRAFTFGEAADSVYWSDTPPGLYTVVLVNP
jgi:hypothetical protein